MSESCTFSSPSLRKPFHFVTEFLVIFKKKLTQLIKKMGTNFIEIEKTAQSIKSIHPLFGNWFSLVHVLLMHPHNLCGGYAKEYFCKVACCRIKSYPD